jgi:hypothetical protein
MAQIVLLRAIGKRISCRKKPEVRKSHDTVPCNTKGRNSLRTEHFGGIHRLKVPKREIFDRSDSRDFYTIKSS